MNSVKSKRQHILDTALTIIDADGIKALTQPRIAKETGLRQSHLTYYFPRKADLYLAVLEASHERTRQNTGGHDSSLPAQLEDLFFNPERMRFFLSILLEIGDDGELLTIFQRHTLMLAHQVSTALGRAPDDAAVIAFLDEMRGVGIRVLVEPELRARRVAVLAEIAQRHGLSIEPNSAI